MITETVKIETGTAAKTVKELRQELRELKDQLLNTQQGTEEYNAALQQAANIQKELKDQMLEVNNTAQDFGQTIGNCTGVLAGMSGAVTAVTGALSLFGVQNDETQKKITATMTALIGVTQGLSKMDSGIKAFKRLSIAIQGATGATSALSKAIISTGIGALVVAVGTLAANWDKVKDVIGSMIGKQKTLTNELYDSVTAAEALKRQYDNINDSLDFALRLMQAQGATNAEVLKVQEKELIRLYGEANTELARLEEHMELFKDSAGVSKDDIERWKELIKSQREIVKGYDDQLTKNRQNQQIEEARAQTAERERLKAEEERKRRGSGSSNKTDPNLKEIGSIEARLKAYEDAMRGELAVLEERYNREKELFEKNGKDITLLTKEYEDEKTRITNEYNEKRRKLEVESAIKTTNDKLKAIEDTTKQKVIEVNFQFELSKSSKDELLESLQKEKDNINNIFQTEKAGIQAEIEALTSLLNQLDPGTEEYLNTQQAITDKNIELSNLETENYINNLKLQGEADEALAEKRKKRFNQTVEGLEGIAAVMDAVADAMESEIEQEVQNGKISEEEGEKRMEAVRGLQIAVTTIQMLAGIATAMSGAFTTKSGPWDIALAAIQAAAIAASGIASIVKIKQVKANGSNGGAASVPPINMGAVVGSSPDFTQSVDGAMTQTSIQDQKVYVTEHDITTTQNKVEVTEANATY